MKTLYIDINNKPIQETDEIKLFTDEGSLQYAFFYELGSQLVGKVGKSIKKAKLISDFDSPENAEAFQKIITQWSVLKAMLFGEELEESFNVVIPKEFISWLSVHVDNEYRSIAAQYDKTIDYTITIDVESFYEEAVGDEFKRNIVKVLKSDSEIEQIVFNDLAVTKRARIVRDIRKKVDVVFVPLEKWNEEPVESSQTKVEIEKNIYNPLVVLSEADHNYGGYRLLIKHLYDDSTIVFEDYVDKINVENNCVYIKQHKVDKEWIAITPYGQTTAAKDNWRHVDLLPRTKIERKFPKCKAIHRDDNLYVINRGKCNDNDWILYNLSLDTITELSNAKGLQDPEWLDYYIIRFKTKNQKIYYHVSSKSWYDDVFDTFAVKIVKGNRCEIYSLISKKQILSNFTFVYVDYFCDSRKPTVEVSRDGLIATAIDQRLNKRVVFDHDGNYLVLNDDQLLMTEVNYRNYTFSNNLILTKHNSLIEALDIKGNILWTVSYDKIEILTSCQYGYIPCVYREEEVKGAKVFALISADSLGGNTLPVLPVKNKQIETGREIFKKIHSLISNTRIKSACIKNVEFLNTHMFSLWDQWNGFRGMHFMLSDTINENLTYDSVLIHSANNTVIKNRNSCVDTNNENGALIESLEILSYNGNGDLISKHEFSSNHEFEMHIII